MRIAFISDWFAEKMGYAENCLPRATAALGHEVHVVTSNVQPYFNSPSYRETYEPFIGPPIVPRGVRSYDGYTLHRLPHSHCLGRLRIRGLLPTLLRIRPDVIQTFEVASLATYEAALGSAVLGSRVFFETHIHASVFPPPGVGMSAARRWQMRAAHFLGRAASWRSEKCYAISPDAAAIAARYLGVPSRKVSVCSLGVDTDLFHAADDEASRAQRKRLRDELGFRSSDIVCIYTGRFAKDKGPQVLAQAIDRLARSGKPFRALFVGNGTAEEVTFLQGCSGCRVHPFVSANELPEFYRAADVGVWPMQESTSQLDAAACGLPLVLSDRIHVRERVEGNGLLYHEGDPADLTARLEELSSAEIRRQLGDAGTRKMREQFSWKAIAASRIRDYEAALRN